MTPVPDLVHDLVPDRARDPRADVPAVPTGPAVPTVPAVPEERTDRPRPTTARLTVAMTAVAVVVLTVVLTVALAAGRVAATADGRAAVIVGPVPSTDAGSGQPGTAIPPPGSGPASMTGAGLAGEGWACTVGAVPRSWSLPSAYTRGCRVNGLPVVSTGETADAALVAAAAILRGMLAGRPDLAAALAQRGFRLGVLAAGQRAVDLPEYDDLPQRYPWVDWDRARAYGASPRRPLAVAPEENLLCTPQDTYPGQFVLTHEIGHSVLDMAVLPDDPGFADRLADAFRTASTLDAYRNTYAMTDLDEYWAEGVQDFFDAGLPGTGPGGAGDGFDGPVFSRATLRAADPALYALIAEVFTEVDWRPVCPPAG